MSIFIDEEDQKQDIEDTLNQSLVQGKYMSLNLSNQEKTMKRMLNEYNKLCAKNMPDILKWSHIDLHKNSSDRQLTITDWKQFLMDNRVQAWINEELYIMMRTKQMSLLEQLGNDRSTATVQALTALMKSTSDESNKIDDGKIFIFSFMPLTEEDERLNNAQTLKSIPTAIRAALQHIPPE